MLHFINNSDAKTITSLCEASTSSAAYYFLGLISLKLVVQEDLINLAKQNVGKITIVMIHAIAIPNVRNITIAAMILKINVSLVKTNVEDHTIGTMDAR